MDLRSRRWFLRRTLTLSAAGLTFLAGCSLPPWPGQPPRVPRIGYLAAGSREGFRAAVADSLEGGLRDLGYVNGQNLAIEYRFANAPTDLDTLAAELVDLKVELIVASGTPAVFAAARASTSVPVVMGGIAADPVATGLVENLARPGRNVTGMSAIGRLTATKRLELLKETVPGLARVAVLWNPTNPGNGPIVEDLKHASGTLQLQLQLLEVKDPQHIQPAIETASREQAQALFVVEDPVTINRPKELTALTAQHRLPAIYAARDHVQEGGLMSYAPDNLDLYRRAATHVDKILKGARPAELPVEQPTKFEFVINLKTAQALGLTIPQPVLLQATEVIK
jgi:putative ABC transport system substrate-binding protein